jgi:hypothetical protein
MASGADGCGNECHEAWFESIFMMLAHHMPSLTESARKQFQEESRLVSSGTSVIGEHYIIYFRKYKQIEKISLKIE